jgi:hypothetical protein
MRGAIFVFTIIILSGLVLLAVLYKNPCAHLGAEWILRRERGEKVCRSMSTGLSRPIVRE